MANQPLTAANIKYLLTLRELEPSGNGGIRCVDVAKKLNITKPSVHTMIKNLRDLGLVVKEHYGAIYMTESGKRAAESYLAHYSALRHSMINSIDLTDEDCRDLVCKALAKAPLHYPCYEAAPLCGAD